MDNTPKDSKFYIDRHFEGSFDGPIDGPNLKDTARNKLSYFWFMVTILSLAILTLIIVPILSLAIGWANDGFEYSMCGVGLFFAFVFCFWLVKHIFITTTNKITFPLSYVKTLAKVEEKYAFYQSEVNRLRKKPDAHNP